MVSEQINKTTLKIKKNKTIKDRFANNIVTYVKNNQKITKSIEV